MNLVIHSHNGKEIAELVEEGIVIHTAGDGTDLVGNLFFQGLDRAIVHQKNLSPDFFDLKTGMAGEILQKFSTYRMRLAIVGDFSQYSSKSLQDFIRESNRLRQICFVSSLEEAMKVLSS